MIKVDIHSLFDSTGAEIAGLFQTLQKIAFLAVSYNEIIKSGPAANRPTSGRRCFYYSTDEKQWYAYTADSSLGDNGWVVIG